MHCLDRCRGGRSHAWGGGSLEECPGILFENQPVFLAFGPYKAWNLVNKNGRNVHTGIVPLRSTKAVFFVEVQVNILFISYFGGG